MKTETILLNPNRNVTLVTYIQDEYLPGSKRPAVLILPGGGYTLTAPSEGEPVAFAYLNAGYNSFVLNYSVDNFGQNPEFKAWPHPLEDFEQAMTYIKENADSLNVDAEKIAVIGFSAGGHLACAAVSMAKNKPRAAVLGYPVTIGTDVHICNETAPDTVSAVNKDTCPCFIFAARDDSVVDIINTVKFTEALVGAGVAFESHIYSHGSHAFSTCERSMNVGEHCNRLPNWVRDSVEWLEEIMQ